MQYAQIMEIIEAQGMQLFAGLIVLAIGLFIVHWLLKLIARSEKYVRIEPTLKGFLDNLLRLVLYVIVLLTAANTMGIPLTSIITLVASAGVAVSLAMQGALSNFVGGIMLLLLKPIKVNEYVKVGDIEGTVQRIGAFYTELVMPDYRHISMPNSKLTDTAVINYTREGIRRLDVFYTVSYSTDMQQLSTLLLGLLESKRELVLSTPAEPVVHMTEMGDSGLKFVLRLWCKTGDYWLLNFYLMEEGKRALDQAGITIPFPQMDVHIKQYEKNSAPQ